MKRRSNKKNSSERVVLKTFVQPGFVPPKRPRLSEREYARALEAIAIGCVDIVGINKKKKLFYLPKRSAKPVSGIWWFGGRTFPGETGKASAVRIFKRETGIQTKEGKLKPVASIDYLFKDREQKPQKISCHSRTLLYSLEMSSGEVGRASENLDSKEYDAGFGVMPFDYRGLLKAKAPKIVLEMYSEIFL